MHAVNQRNKRLGKTMKAKLLLLSASVLAANVAMAEVKFYGKANVSLQGIEVEENDVKTQDNFELISNASRLGVKGSSDINHGLEALFQVEYEVQLDDGDKGGKTLTQRNSFVGVKGDFGTVMAGIHDTPTKMIAKPVDIFSDLKFADIKNAVEGENRQKNMVMYRSPDLAGFKIDAMFAPGEEKTDVNDQNGIADAISASVSYKIAGFSLAASYDGDVDDQDAVRLVGAYSIGAFATSLMLQQAEIVDSASNEKEEGIVATASYKIDDWKIKALVGTATESEDTVEDLDRNQLVLGADYKLAKNAKVFAFVTDYEDKDSGVNSSNEYYGIGTELKF